MWELDHKEGWVPKNWCFWTVVLEKILGSPLESKDFKQVNPKGNQPKVFMGRTDTETENSNSLDATAKSLQSCLTLCDPTDGSTRLPCPWDSPGKNTDFLLQFRKVKNESEVAQSYLTLCDPMDCSTLGFPVLHQFLEPAQTHVIQPSHPLSSLFAPAFNISQHQGLFQWLSSLHQVAKVLEF